MCLVWTSSVLGLDVSDIGCEPLVDPNIQRIEDQVALKRVSGGEAKLGHQRELLSNDHRDSTKANLLEEQFG